MGNAIVLTGEYTTLNALAGSTSIEADTNPGGAAIDPNFSIKNLANGEPGIITRLAAASDSAQVINVDLNRCRNGGFETWTRTNVPDSWENHSTSMGTLTEETTVINEGTSAVRLDAPDGASSANLRQKILIKPDDLFNLSVALRGDGTNTTSAYCWNPATGSYVNSSGSWVATRTAFHSRSTATYSTNTQGVQMESLSDCQTGAVSLVLEVNLPGAASAFGYVDSFRLWPTWNFSAIFGHNIPDSVTLEVRSDDNSAFSSPTTRITYASSRNKKAFYDTTTAAGSGERYVQLRIGGPQAEAPWIGEWVLFQALATHPTPIGLRVPLTITNIAGNTGMGVAGVNETESTFIETSFPWVSRSTTSSNWEDLKIFLGHAARWGGYSSILVPVGPDTIGSLTGSKPDIYFGKFTINEVETNHNLQYEISCSMEEVEYVNHVK